VKRLYRDAANQANIPHLAKQIRDPKDKKKIIIIIFFWALPRSAGGLLPSFLVKARDLNIRLGSWRVLGFPGARHVRFWCGANQANKYINFVVCLVDERKSPNWEYKVGQVDSK
jgi:hypothetical protein